MYEITTTIKATMEQIEQVSLFYSWKKEDGDAIEFAKAFLDRTIKDVVGEPSRRAIETQMNEVKQQHLDELDKGLSQVVTVDITEVVTPSDDASSIKENVV